MSQQDCKHDMGFKFLCCDAADRMPGVWACNNDCGFALNFNPTKFPDGVAYLDVSNPEATKVISLQSEKRLGLK